MSSDSRSLIPATSRGRRQWAKRINAVWCETVGGTVIGIIETGKLLIAAKAALEHGEFESMVETDLRRTSRWARYLMAVARDARIVGAASNRKSISGLPPELTTLYSLTRFTDEEWEEFIGVTEEIDKGSVGEFLRLRRRAQYVEAKGSDPMADLDALVRSGRKFKTIAADPPWSFKVYSGKGKERSAERHYDTMDLNDICALQITELADEDCALFLWSVWPEMPGALRVIKAWGFEYKTAAFVYVKRTRGGGNLFWGMGYWTRANTEPCLLATRGKPSRLSTAVHQVIFEPVRKHSEKPDTAYVRMEQLVAGPRLELFARKERPGWTTWGNEVEPVEYKEAAE